jgi:hypothetical protein
MINSEQKHRSPSPTVRDLFAHVTQPHHNQAQQHQSSDDIFSDRPCLSG